MDKKNASRVGKKGGDQTKKKRGSVFYSKIGQKGGQTTRDTHDITYYQEIGRLGGKNSQKKRNQRKAL